MLFRLTTSVVTYRTASVGKKIAETAELTTREIAARITKHLQRFEKDPAINVRKIFNKETRQWEPTVKHGEGLGQYYWANASHEHGQKVGILYISYQGRTKLSKEDALKYLAWLDAGNVGKHQDCLGSRF